MATRGTRAAHDSHSIHSANLSSDTRELNMTDTAEYTPPEVWVWEKDNSPKWRYGSINRCPYRKLKAADDRLRIG
jgi:hypothetical protein